MEHSTSGSQEPRVHMRDIVAPGKAGGRAEEAHIPEPQSIPKPAILIVLIAFASLGIMGSATLNAHPDSRATHMGDPGRTLDHIDLKADVQTIIDSQGLLEEANRDATNMSDQLSFSRNQLFTETQDPPSPIIIKHELSNSVISNSLAYLIDMIPSHIEQGMHDASEMDKREAVDLCDATQITQDAIDLGELSENTDGDMQGMHDASDSRAQTESPGKETGTTHLFNGMSLNPLEQCVNVQGIHGLASEMDEREAVDLCDATQITQDTIDPGELSENTEENDLPDGDMHGMSYDRGELNDSPLAIAAHPEHAISDHQEHEDLKNTGKINKENNSCSSPEHRHLWSGIIPMSVLIIIVPANWFKGVHQALKTHVQQTMLRPCYCSPENNRGVAEAVRLWTAFMVALLTLVG